MATDPDRQSDGLKARERRALSHVPGGLHAAFQLAWALAMTAPLAGKIDELAARPTAGSAFGVIAISAVWALVAALAWGLRVLALTSCGAFGRASRNRIATRAALKARRQG